MGTKGVAGGLQVLSGSVPTIVFQSAIPFIMPGGTSASQFTMGNNGAISNLVALLEAYPQAFIYMPANAIAAGVAAGWYYFVASSTTAGTVYNNLYSWGDPRLAVPATPTAFATTGPGGVTPQLAVISGPSFTLPGGALGANGMLRHFHEATFPATASNKTLALRFGGTNANSNTINSGTNVSAGFIGTVRNRNSQSRQISNTYGTYSGQSGAASRQVMTVNTAVDITVDYRMTLTAASDSLVLESFDVVAHYGK